MQDDPSPRKKPSAGSNKSDWAPPVDRLKAEDVPEDATNLNVDGRHVSTAIQGFGQMWQKTYRIRFQGAHPDPREVVRVWKEEFSNFWPEGNRFYKQGGPIEPGDVALLNLAGPGGVQAPGGKPIIATGVLVVYADEDSFSFLTSEGHIFAGMSNFSAYEEEGATFAQVQALFRASDPLYELFFRLGPGHKMEDEFWRETLKNLAARFGASGTPTIKRVRVDSHVQWTRAGNIWKNAAIRTTLHNLSSPIRWIGRKLGGK